MLNIISLGAGVQSSTMALMAGHGEITPMPDCAIFADTQAEPKAVYEWLDWLEKQLPFPVYRVTKGDLRAESLRMRISSKTGHAYFKFYAPTFSLNRVTGEKWMLPRKCTTDFKLVPIEQAIRFLAKIPRGCKEIKVHSWIGISTDEASRMKPATVTKRINDQSLKVPHPFILNRWPLIENRISRDQCKAWMKAYGYPEPPKSACFFCPYHNDAMWRDMKLNRPDEFAQAVQFERDLEIKTQAFVHLDSKEFLHSSRVPLDQVDFSTDEDRGQLNMFENECEGMCGV